ncbi:MAG: iron-sulfur cluster assembly accessory protein [Leptolyngbyaceae cyanobacterium MO_188.B28]|nr:iron-sulfur cluster assembly accessory protein [Leptolyngbyaceae cyanobacterium MO_188.B28]
MIHLSPAAVTEIKRLQANQQSQKALFRLRIQAGGCFDWFYQMGFDQTINAEDAVYNCGDVQVVVNSKALHYVEGLTIDYSEDLIGGGFRFMNPNASQHCGCGNSFAIRSPQMSPTDISG